MNYAKSIIDPHKEDTIIYVHPKTPMAYPRNIPISLPALIKRIPYKINGYCANNIDANILRQARIIIIDVHWFFSLYGAKELVSKTRKINKDVVFVAGGITATEFPHQLVGSIGIDYVIRGDGEIPFPLLINALVDGDDLHKIPNLIGRDNFSTTFNTKPYSLTKTDLDENNFYDIDFFPLMKTELMRLHAKNPGMPSYIYPFILPFRGCPVYCDFCIGAPDAQSKLFGRKVVVRSASRLREDFEELESQEWIKFYNCLLDFITLLPDKYAIEAIPKKSRLKLQYEFTKTPSLDQLDLLLSSFSGGTIHFSTDQMHLTSENFAEPSVLIPLIQRVQQKKQYVPILDYSGIFTKKNVNYRKAVIEVLKRTGCLAYDGSIWWSDFPMLDDYGYGNPDKFEYFMNNAVTTKNAVANKLNTAINILDGVLPNKVLIGLRKMYYELFYKYPLLLKYRK